MKIIGLTGGIGSGKTTVAKMFAELGVPIYFADIEAKKITNSSKVVRRKLIELLGAETYLKGELNRKYVADKIFNNAELLASVNAIIHPKVAAHFKRWASKQTTKYVIKEAAILFENGSFKNCDFTILVIAPKATRIKRVMERDQATFEQVAQRINNQWSDKKKKQLADFIIENIDINTTKNEVIALHQKLENLLNFN